MGIYKLGERWERPLEEDRDVCFGLTQRMGIFSVGRQNDERSVDETDDTPMMCLAMLQVDCNMLRG